MDLNVSCALLSSALLLNYLFVLVSVHCTGLGRILIRVINIFEPDTNYVITDPQHSLPVQD